MVGARARARAHQPLHTQPHTVPPTWQPGPCHSTHPLEGHPPGGPGRASYLQVLEQALEQGVKAVALEFIQEPQGEILEDMGREVTPALRAHGPNQSR